MTPTWEDGASSTARETAMNRESAARLTRTEILWSMLSPESDYPARELAEAWKNVLLFYVGRVGQRSRSLLAVYERLVGRQEDVR